jgi:hypothetical protein
MAIEIQISNSRPMNLAYQACKQEVSITTIPKQITEVDFCLCKFDCDYEELALASISDDDDFKNDKTSFLVDLSDSSDTVEFILVNERTGQEFNLDATYGTEFPQGTWSENPNKIGYVLNWRDILINLTVDKYHIRIEQTSFNRLITSKTHTFNLLPYSEEVADGTIRFVTTHDGVIEGGFDYTGTNWKRYIRLYGEITSNNYTVESTEYQNSQRVLKQIQDRVLTDFEIKTSLIPSQIYEPLIKDKFIANKIEFTDYNLFSNQNLENYQMKFESVDDTTMFSMNRRSPFTFTFKDVQQTPIKRNKF